MNRPLRLMLLCLLFIFPLWVVSLALVPGAWGSDDPPKKKSLPIELNLDTGYGLESNIFLSNRNPQSDSFIYVNASANALIRPTEGSVLFAFLDYNYEHYLEFNQADRTFANLVFHYRYSLRSSMAVGVSNTVSYSDLKLLDTEGDTLPLDQFRSLSDQIRLFGQYYLTKKLRLEAGIFYLFFNVKEVGDEASLDFKEIGTYGSSKLTLGKRLSANLQYKYRDLRYDEKIARNRDTSFTGTFDPNNPDLRIKRHELSANLQYRKAGDLEARGLIKYRLNDDTFENHLTYHQIEFRPRVKILRFAFSQIEVEGIYKNRRYTDRSRGIGSRSRLAEVFYIGKIRLSRNVLRWLSVFTEYKEIRKQSNDSSREFTDHKGIIGLTSAY